MPITTSPGGPGSSETVQVQVTGLDQTLAGFNRLKNQAAEAALRKALQAGIDVIAAEVKQRAPVKTGELKSAIKTTVEVKSRNSGVAKVGFGWYGYVARFVETGHRIIPRRASNLKRKQRIAASIDKVSPHPFMRPALDAVKSKAISAFVQSIQASIRGGQSTGGKAA